MRPSPGKSRYRTCEVELHFSGFGVDHVLSQVIFSGETVFLSLSRRSPSAFASAARASIFETNPPFAVPDQAGCPSFSSYRNSNLLKEFSIPLGQHKSRPISAWGTDDLVSIARGVSALGTNRIAIDCRVTGFVAMFTATRTLYEVRHWLASFSARRFATWSFPCCSFRSQTSISSWSLIRASVSRSAPFPWRLSNLWRRSRAKWAFSRILDSVVQFGSVIEAPTHRRQSHQQSA